MPTTLPKKNAGSPSAGLASESHLLGATLFIALVLCVLTRTVAPSLVLPALGVVVVLSGAVLGAYALVAKRLGLRSNDALLDIAGVPSLFGFAAAIVCDKAEALQALTMLIP